MTLQLVAGIALLAVTLFWTPFDRLILEGIEGLTLEMSDYGVPAMRLTLVMALFWALAALSRALPAGVRSTRMLAVTAVLRLGTAAAVGSVTMFSDGKWCLTGVNRVDSGLHRGSRRAGTECQARRALN